MHNRTNEVVHAYLQVECAHIARECFAILYFIIFTNFNLLISYPILRFHFKMQDRSYLNKRVHHVQPSTITNSFIQSIEWREGNITNKYNQ